MSNILVDTFRTSMGISNRFFVKEGKIIKYYPYLPYEKISDNEYIVKPDLSVKPIELSIISIQSKQLKPYDENRKYINVFQNTSEENNVMNYDDYGFPIFDDDYEDEVKQIQQEPDKIVNIKKEDKEETPKDKFSLF